MIIGETIEASTSDPQVYWTPWFPRQADNGAFTFERIHSTLGAAEAVTVYTKSAEDAGTGSPATDGSFTQIGSTRFFEAVATELQDLVRFRILLRDTTGWLHFRFLPPTWFATAHVPATP